MPLPIPGKVYIVQDETTLSQVAARAYGDPTLWPRIWRANQSNLRFGDLEQIFTGDVIIIPLQTEIEDAINTFSAIKLSGKQPNDLTIMLENREIKTSSARVIRTMDTIADGFSAVMPWEYGKDPQLDKLVRPYGYTPARVFIGGELLVSGLLYTTSSGLDETGSIKELECWSFTADLIDSTLKPPYEKNNMDLSQIAVDIAKATGISIVFFEDVDIGGPFDRVTANETETIFSFLLKLARQRNLLLSSTARGSLLFTQTTENKKPVAILEEGGLGIMEFKARFDGRRRFNTYRAIGKSPAGNKEGIAKDDAVPRSRSVTFIADETIAGDVQKTAEWKRSIQLAEALSKGILMDSWYAPSGELWRENTFVTLKSPTLHLPDGFDFLIRAVEYIENENKQTTVLSLVPPEVYTGEPIQDPWK